MKIITKADAKLQKLPDGVEQEGYYVDAPKVGTRFLFISSERVDGVNEVLYTETSKVVGIFTTEEGYILKTENSTYVLKEIM